MENYTICFINESKETMNQAVKILLGTMSKADMW